MASICCMDMSITIGLGLSYCSRIVVTIANRPSGKSPTCCKLSMYIGMRVGQFYLCCISTFIANAPCREQHVCNLQGCQKFA